MHPDTTTVDAAFESFRVQGFDRPVTPQDGPESLSWPRNLSDLSPTDLSRHLTHWTGWSAFADFELSRARSNRRSSERALKLFEAKAILKQEGKTVTEKKAAVHASEEYCAIEERLQFFTATAEILESLVKGYQSKYNAASREIGRRKDDGFHNR